MSSEKWLKVQKMVKSQGMLKIMRDESCEFSESEGSVRNITFTQTIQLSIAQGTASESPCVSKLLIGATNFITATVVPQARLTSAPSLSRMVGSTVNLMSALSLGDHSQLPIETEVITKIQDKIDSILSGEIKKSICHNQVLSDIMASVKSTLVTISQQLTKYGYAECSLCEEWKNKLNGPFIKFEIFTILNHGTSPLTVNIDQATNVFTN